MSFNARQVARNLRETGDMIMFRHTVFALPFAIISLITAAAPGWPSLAIWAWVVVAMVAARTAAMTFNRIVDQAIDGQNPRTTTRALPAGRLSRGYAWSVVAVSGAVFVAATAALNTTCLLLATPTLAFLLGYSYAKRFTALAHGWLGLALGAAPVGAWLAIRESLTLPPLILGIAVSFWVAGFDIIYSLQDEEFDRQHSLHSMPARWGGARALFVARVFHGLAFLGFALFAAGAGGGVVRIAAVMMAGLLLVRQHRLVSVDNLDAVNAAFFQSNGMLAVGMCVAFFLARLVTG